MKITNYGPAGVNPYKKEMQKAETVKKGDRARNDQVEISAEAMQLQQKTNPARREKIARIKEQIENGTYEINHWEIAEGIYNYYVKKRK